MKEALTQRLLAGLPLREGERVLELGAGTGELARRLSAAVGADGTVAATDVAPGMVELIELTTADLPNVEAGRRDAAAIDAPDGSYDAVVFRMGLMFLVPPVDAL